MGTLKKMFSIAQLWGPGRRRWKRFLFRVARQEGKFVPRDRQEGPGTSTVSSGYASFKQVAGCLPSCLPFPAIHQLSYYCPEPACGCKRSEHPPHTHTQVTQVLCCKNTVGHLKHTANDRHHEAIKAIALGGGLVGVAGDWKEGLGLPSRSCSPGGWLQEHSEN